MPFQILITNTVLMILQYIIEVIIRKLSQICVVLFGILADWQFGLTLV